MNVNEYIASGILEGYALGSLSEQERKEVECMSHIYPEIREELIRIQITFENLAMKDAIAPNKEVKAKILNSISSLPQNKTNELSNPNSQLETPKVVSFQRYAWYFTTAAAAATILLLLYFRWQDSKIHNEEITALKELNQKLEDDYLQLDASMVAMNDINSHMMQELKMFRNPEFKTVFLIQSKPEAAGSMAIICWNQNNKSIMIAADKMPEYPTNKSLQLWAIVDGKPMDMGVLPDGITGNFITLESKVDNPQAFAITIENKGGSAVPTKEEMVLAGNL